MTTHIDLTGRVAIITGGARGIGYAAAQRMLSSGATVVLWDMDGGKLDEAKAELNDAGEVTSDVVELTDEASEPVFHDLGEADDGVQRRAQLVAHIGEELGFGAVGAFGSGLLLEIALGHVGELLGLRLEFLSREIGRAHV